MADIRILKKFDDPHALLISVENGRGALKSELCRKSDYHDDCTDYYKLTLCGKPILQNYKAVSPTSSGLLAAGYGIENVRCAELSEICDRINEDFVSLERSAKIISPILGLLETGVYLLGIMPHIPTDGKGRFFWNVPSEKTYMQAHCVDFYQSDIMTVCESFPKFLYPTQSTACYNKKRVCEYVKRFEEKGSLPTPIVLNLGTFMSAVIDGHHKACAAALLGHEIDCLTIMSVCGVYKDFRDGKTTVSFLSDEKFSFDAAEYPELLPYVQKFEMKRGGKYEEKFCADREPFCTEIFAGINDERYEAAARKYLTAEDIAFRKYFGIKNITKEYIDELFDNINEKNVFALIEMIRTGSVVKDPLAQYAAAKAAKAQLSLLNKGYVYDKKLLDAAVTGLTEFCDEENKEIEDILIELFLNDSIDEQTRELIKECL